MKSLTEVRNRLEDIKTELETLSELGDDAFTEEDQTRWNELITEDSELRTKLEKLETRERQLEEIRSRASNGSVEHGAHVGAGDPDPLAEAEFRGKRNPWSDLERVGTYAYTKPEHAASEFRSRAIDAVEGLRGLTDDQRKAALKRIGSLNDADLSHPAGAVRTARHILTVSNPEYVRGFNSMLKGFARSGQVHVPEVVQRAMSLTDAAGGYAVPLPVDPTLIVDADGSLNPIRQIATVRTATTDVVRTVSASEVVASWDGEFGVVSDDAPTFAPNDITMHKAQAFIPFSIEIGEDYPNFSEDIRMLFSEARDNLEATAFISGTGTNQPVGIVTALTGTGSVVNSATADVFAIDDVYVLEESLPARYRGRARFVANKSIYNDVRQAGGASQSTFWANLGQGQPPTLIGYPAHEASAMDGTINATADNYVLLFGDFSYYRIYDRVGLSVELVPHLLDPATGRPNGSRGLYAYWRVGADVVLNRALRMLNV